MSDRDHTGDDLAAPPPDELAELRALAAEVGAEPASWIDPPAGLWDRIAADVGGTPSLAGPAPEQAPAPEPVLADLDVERAHRRRRVLPWVAGIAAVLLVAVGVAVVLTRPDEPTVVATAELEPLGPTGEGQAELIDDGGDLRLRVDVGRVDAGDDGFLELWVIDSGVTRLVSLGPLRPDGTYDLPASLDPREYPVVDVSVEPVDGDPTHSGDSVLRVTLEF